ncbi:MAG: hypothetical protein JNJ59_11835, partial [Deltaproteobacteria bacterium]|nr:hypothetical protein [Deltaproteobacteria bacterium]
MSTPPRDFGELGRLPGFELVSSLAFVDVLESLGKTHPEAADAVLDGVARLMQIASTAPRDKKLKALKAMNFNYLQRLWASRPPALSPELGQRLAAAMGPLFALLSTLVEELRPKPIALGRLASVRVNVLRRRIESAPAPLRAELFAALSRGEHTTTLDEWTRDAGYFGMPASSRPVIEKLAQVVADAEALGEAPRRARHEATAAKRERPSETLRAAQALLATMSTAPAPLEELRRMTVSLFDARISRFAVKCHHALSCLESSTCNQVAIDLEEPLAPFFICEARGRPCTLKRMAAETLVEALSGVTPAASDFEIEALDALLSHCQSSASARMISRL